MRRVFLFLFSALLFFGCSIARSPSGRANKNPGVSPNPSPSSAGTHRIPGHDGQTVGNGGENLPLSAGSAWFLGPREVRVCYALSPDFGVDADTVSSAISTSLARWKSYLVSKSINSRRLYPRRGIQDGDPELIFNTSPPSSRCTGDEELTFYLGDRSERFVRSDRPVAFADRLSYDMIEGWGSGFIWVAPQGSLGPGHPNWSDEEFLVATLSHEIGHTLGCGHNVPGSIMEEDFGGILRRAYSDPELRARIAQIDRTRQLIMRSPSSGLGLVFNQGRVSEFTPSLDPFQPDVLVGAGEFILRLFSESSPRGHGTGGVLQIHRNAVTESGFTVGREWLRISSLRRIGYFQNPAPVFKMVFVRPNEGPVVLNSHTEAYTYMGSDSTVVHINHPDARLNILQTGGSEESSHDGVEPLLELR